MSQFDVYTNTNPASTSTYPYLIDIQSPLLETLETRLVIPLMQKSSYAGKSIKNLTPIIPVLGVDYVVLTPQMAAISKKHLGKPIENHADRRNEIVSSVDFLITGF